jgi:hypothetical protein
LSSFISPYNAVNIWLMSLICLKYYWKYSFRIVNESGKCMRKHSLPSLRYMSKLRLICVKRGMLKAYIRRPDLVSLKVWYS